MVVVIGNVEIHDSLVLAILILHIGKAQTAILDAIVRLDGFLSGELDLGWSTILAIHDRELDYISYTQSS